MRPKSECLDGKHWALRYANDEVEKIRNSPLRYEPRVNCSIVVTIDCLQVNHRITNRHLAPEQAASEYALDVERFYSLYPDVVDQKRINATRVEARLQSSSRPSR